MKKYLFIFLAILWCLQLDAQYSNPFEVYRDGNESTEIKNRNNVTLAVEDTVIVDTINTFEAIAEEVELEDSIENIGMIVVSSDTSEAFDSDVRVLDLDNLNIDKDTIEANRQANIVEQNNEESLELSHESRFSNPFEVDHVPIRKSKYKKKQKLSKQTSIVKEVKKTPVLYKDIIEDNNLIRRVIGNYKVGDFVFWLILFSLLLLTVVVNLQRKTLPKLFKALINDNQLKSVQREEDNGFSTYFVLLYFIYFINISLLIYLSIVKLGYFSNSFYLFLLIMGGVLFVYVSRHFFMSFLAYIFPIKDEIKQYDFTIKVFNVVIGVILIPFIVLIAYSPNPIWEYALFAMGTIYIVLMLFRSIRGIFFALNINNLSFFHFFIYLCACEIAPLSIAIKLIAERIAIY